MPRPGGEADKLATIYEGVWTVDILLDLLEDAAVALTVEPLEESLGVEFDVTRPDGTREYHSVKRQTSESEWSIAKLCQCDPRTGRSILADLFQKLDQAQENRAVFVSSTGANRLRELCQRATNCETVEEFEARISTSAPLKREFEDRIPQLTGGSKAIALDHLRRLRVSLIDERELIRRVEHRISACLCADDGSAVIPKDARLLLAEIVLENLGKPLTATTVRELLRPAFMLRAWAREPSVRARVSSVNETYCRHVEAELINGTRIPRSESADAYAALTAPDGPKAVILLAPAGYGKSCVVAETASLLEKGGIPCLCLRLDGYPEARSLNDWGAMLGLPGPPHVVLQNISPARRSVLVVDQLDAMSIVSGRSPALWDLFEQIVTEVQSYRNMRLLVACRKYDLENDHRLRRIAANEALAKQVPISELSTDRVREALATAGVDPASLGDTHLEVLRVPYHMSLFLETLPQDSPAFRDIAELYSRYWDRKRRCVTHRLKRDAHWLPVIDAVTDYLSEHQVLSAPKRIIEQWEDDAQAMVSEHVLVCENRNIRFFHEGFFDYAFARRFVDLGGDLLEMLGGSEQHLFRRAQVRQVLAYSRDTDQSAYLRFLEGILFHPGIRFHLKKVVISGLSQYDQPTSEEWKVVQRARADATLRAHAYMAIRDQLGWFDLLDRLGVWEQWLGDADDSHVDRTCWLLDGPVVMEKRSARVAELLRPYVGTSDAWKNRLRYMMAWGRAYYSREMCDLFLELIRDGTLDESRPSVARDLWGMLHEMADKKPEYAAEAIGCWLDHRLSMISDSEEGNPLEDVRHASGAAERVILKTAESVPEHFVRRVLPPVGRFVQRTALPEDDGCVRDRVWRHRSYGYHHSVDSSILAGLKTALEWLAVNRPELLDQATAPLEAEVYDTIEFLLVSAWPANPEHYAAKCARYLLQCRHRLKIGYSSWSDGNGHAAVTRAALQRITPYCGAEVLTELEDAIIGFLPAWERGSPRHRGYLEYLLLQSVNLSRNV
jgi:hypothetical protein